jgi:YesN/AraC family two-component response regulator
MFVYLEKGFLKMQVGKTVHIMEKGDLLLIPKGTPYRPIEVKDVSYYFLHFLAAPAQESKDQLHMRFNHRLPEGEFEFSYWGGHSNVKINALNHTADNDSIRNIINKIAAISIKTNEQKLLLDCYVRELILSVSEKNMDDKKISYNTVKITKYIDGNYSDDITLSSLSEKFKLSESYIARLFKNELGTTSAKYINRTRITNACKMLLYSSKTVGEISEAVGFKDQYYFTRIFRSFLNMTPTQYRKSRIVT